MNLKNIMQTGITFGFIFMSGCAHSPQLQPSETQNAQYESKTSSKSHSKNNLAKRKLSEQRKPSSNHDEAAPVAPGFYNNADASEDQHAIIPAIELVKRAHNSIEIEIYELEDLTLIQELKNAVARGVEVRIIKDPTPVPKKGACMWFNPPKEGENASCAGIRELMAELNRDANHPNVVPFKKSELCDQDSVSEPSARCYEHGKIIIADHQQVLISTGNFNSTNLCDLVENPKVCNRDFSYVSNDRRDVNKILKIFNLDFKQTRYPLEEIALKDDPSVTVSPYSLQPLVELINEAHESIQIENQYLKEPELNAALIKFAINHPRSAEHPNAGVELVVSSLCAFGPPKTPIAKFQALFGPMEDAGIQVKTFTKKIRVGRTGGPSKPGYLHAKAIVIDGKRAWIGSVNGSESALNHNREYGKFFDDQKDVNSLSKILHDDFTDKGALSWKDTYYCAENRRNTRSASTVEQ